MKVLNPIEDISNESSISFGETINEKVPSIVDVVPIFFFKIPTAANGISKSLSSIIDPSINKFWAPKKFKLKKERIKQ